MTGNHHYKIKLYSEFGRLSHYTAPIHEFSTGKKQTAYLALVRRLKDARRSGEVALVREPGGTNSWFWHSTGTNCGGRRIWIRIDRADAQKHIRKACQNGMRHYRSCQNDLCKEIGRLEAQVKEYNDTLEAIRATEKLTYD